MRCVPLLRMLMKSLKRNDEFFMRKLFWELSKILIRELFGFSWENYIENSRNILRREMLRFCRGNSCEQSRTFSTEISTRIRIYSSWETSQRDLMKRILHGDSHYEKKNSSFEVYHKWILTVLLTLFLTPEHLYISQVSKKILNLMIQQRCVLMKNPIFMIPWWLTKHTHKSIPSNKK